MDMLEDYWASHLGTGTLGNYQYEPTIPYSEALGAAREDERNYNASASTMGEGMDHSDHADHRKVKRHGGHAAMEQSEAIGPDVSSPLPMLVFGDPLNETSFVNPEDWQLQYNGMTDFETNEIGHATYTIVIIFVAVLLPILLSLLRFIPGFPSSGTAAFIRAWLITPAIWGKKHREPVAKLAGGVLLPTRGQALFIALLSFFNVIFLIAPYVHTHPQSTFASGSDEQSLSTIGNRAGVMAMGNATAMVLFATRNNVLLYLTDWSPGTYILLHRVLGYWTIFHTVLHSVMLLAYYKTYGTYSEEIIRLYWIWGIVATVAVVAILPLSLLVVRQKAYELFKTSHVGLTVLFTVGYYYHIWYCYGFNWGYEVFAYIFGAIWGLEHVVRIVRLATNGLRTATVTPVAETGGEYVKIEVEGVSLHGTAYLTFPTLSWRFWDSHPFSVAYSGSATAVLESPGSESPSLEKETPEDVSKEPTETTATLPLQTPAEQQQQPSATKRSVFFTRTRSGATSLLGARASAAGPSGARLKVLVDGSYQSNAHNQLKSCSALLCISGGIGITALLPLLAAFPKPSRAQLHWGVRKRDLTDALTPQLEALSRTGVEVATKVGERLDLETILRRELVWSGPEQGKLGIVVCGPASMADDVRAAVARMSRETVAKRGFVFVDEAFSW